MKTSGDYLSSKAWLRDIAKGKNVILCKGAALEYLELFVGYVNEGKADVYALKDEQDENMNITLADSFDKISFEEENGVMYTTLSQTINDMLEDNDSDLQALCEALISYYYDNNESFNGLLIKPHNAEKFEALKEMAMSYYNY